MMEFQCKEIHVLQKVSGDRQYGGEFANTHGHTIHRHTYTHNTHTHISLLETYLCSVVIVEGEYKVSLS